MPASKKQASSVEEFRNLVIFTNYAHSSADAPHCCCSAFASYAGMVLSLRQIVCCYNFSTFTDKKES